MKKRMKKVVGLVLAMMLLGSSNTWANVSAVSTEISDNTGEIQPRSRYLASASSQVTNEGEGVLGIYADFKSFDGVESGSIEINLQRRKSASSGSWEPVDTFTEEFDGADYPNGVITFAYTEFEVHGLKTDYYYRLTCYHKVKTPNGTETKTTQTDGVLLTSYPVFRIGEETE